MDRVKSLVLYLQENDPYPCLHLVEASLASLRYCTDGMIPDWLIQSIEKSSGDSQAQHDMGNLLNLGIFEEVSGAEAQGIRLKKKMQPSVEKLVKQLRCCMTLELGSGCIAASKYLSRLADYLLSSDAHVSLRENADDHCLLESDSRVYRLLLTLSPFWLPLATEANSENTCFIAFGPFASQSWDEMYPYYAVREFRSQVGLYDPWSRQKLCLCKGSLPAYIDWFFRDQYNGRFSIPADFCEALHKLGLMRYNDER